jgi:hypothetical protein
VKNEKKKKRKKDKRKFPQIVVHNAGSLGDMSRRSSQLSDEQQWHQ